jgi:hypothetical protein
MAYDGSQIQGSNGKVPNTYGSNKNSNLTYSDLGNGINSTVAMNQLNQNRLIYKMDRSAKASFDFQQPPGNL